MSCSDYTRQRSFFFHLFQYFFIRIVLCPADPLHPTPYIHLKSLYPFDILFFIVHVSAPYSVTLHISALTIIFWMSLFSPPFNNYFIFVTILFIISLWDFLSSDTRLPKYM